MPVELPADLPASMYPLAWIVGSWHGDGVIEHPTLEQPVPFHQEVHILHEGQDYLTYHSRMSRPEDGALLEEESGFWRAPRETTVEVLVVHPTGVAEIYLGSARAGVVELATDVVARTSTAGDYNAARRMYGQVDGDLLWVLEVAARGTPMTSYSSARLSRVDTSAPAEHASHRDASHRDD